MVDLYLDLVGAGSVVRGRVSYPVAVGQLRPGPDRPHPGQLAGGGLELVRGVLQELQSLDLGRAGHGRSPFSPILAEFLAYGTSQGRPEQGGPFLEVQSGNGRHQLGEEARPGNEKGQ